MTVQALVYFYHGANCKSCRERCKGQGTVASEMLIQGHWDGWLVVWLLAVCHGQTDRQQMVWQGLRSVQILAPKINSIKGVLTGGNQAL